MKIKKSNNSTFVILIFEVSIFRNIGRSKFAHSKFWLPPVVSMMLIFIVFIEVWLLLDDESESLNIFTWREIRWVTSTSLKLLETTMRMSRDFEWNYWEKFQSSYRFVGTENIERNFAIYLIKIVSIKSLTF